MYFPPSMVTKLRNAITNFRQEPDELLFEAWERYKLLIDRCPNHNMLPMTQIDTFYNGLTLRHRDTINTAADGTFMKRRPKECYDLIENMTAHHNDWDSFAQRTVKLVVVHILIMIVQPPLAKLRTYMLQEPTIKVVILTNLKEDLKGITTRSGIAYKGPMIPTTSSPPKVVERKTEVTKDTVPPTNKGSTKDVQPLILLTNKEKLFKLDRTPLNEHCSTVLLKKLAEKLRDLGKFLILCDFSGMDECLALADLDSSINLMPLSMWKMLSLPELSFTCMTLELADRSISRPVGVAEDVSVKVGKFHFLADFVVVNFDVDPRVPLILGRSFLKTRRALIDVYGGELTLRVGKEAVTFNLDQTSRYSSNYDDNSVNRIDVIDVNQQVKAVTPNCETCGGPHPTMIVQPSLAKPRTYMLREPIKVVIPTNLKMNTASSSGLGTLPGNTITNPKEDLMGITTRSGTAYQGPTIPTTPFSLPQVVERETEVTKDTVPPTNNESTTDVQPSVVQTKNLIPNSEPIVAPIIEPVVAPVSALKPNKKPLIPYPSRLHDQKLRDKANDQKEKFFQIFKDLNFNISFADALILMPKFGPAIKTLLTNKDKLSELARTPLNEHCLAVLLKKFPEKLGDAGKFLIPCDFPRMDKCLTLADLGASINLMPLLAWNKISLPKLSPMCMTLELADRSISRLVGVVEDVFVKTRRALIDVFKGEMTLRVGKKAITFNLDQTSRYSANYNYMTANRIDVIDMTCEEYSQEVLGFFDVIASGNPTPYYDPIISTSSSTQTPFRDSDFLLEEVDAFLALKDEATLLEVDNLYFDIEGDILLLKAFLNDDPSLPPPNQVNYLPQVRKELKICKAKTDKSSIDEPPKVELKDLAPHLEYAFLEGDDKFPIIIAKDLSDEEKTALIKVLKSHKRAIA
nr:reverse transcriptase domain-containing protein [Tanacetum cinerariifolium]